MTKYTIDLPKKFCRDHMDRALPSGEVVKELGKTYRMEMTAPVMREWLSDANHYSDCAGYGWSMGDEGLAMQASARGTVSRIEKFMLENGIDKNGPIAEGES